MELEEIRKPLPVSDQVSETELSRSLLSVQSRSVSEIATDDVENIPGSGLNLAPGNPSESLHDGDSVPIKKTTIIDDDYETASVRSLKNYHKHQHGKPRKNRNKVAPVGGAQDNLERPTSAPSNRTRQWLKEIDDNRPMTAGPRVVLSKSPLALPPPQLEGKAFERQLTEESLAPEDSAPAPAAASAVEEPSQPAINETAYIPYEYARSMISRVAGDMNKMKSNHLTIIHKVELEYEKMEHHTQDQFNECISQLQDRQKRRIEHYRQVIELLHNELQSKGALRSEAIANLRERNKELALERKRIQQQLSRSKLQFVPVQSDNRQPVEDSKAREEEADERRAESPKELEEKIVEDAKETEKRLSRESSRDVLPLAVATEIKEEQEKEDSDDEEPPASDVRDESEEERSDGEDQEEAQEEEDDVKEHDVISDVAKVALIKEATDVSLKKQKEPEKKEEKGKEKKKGKSPAKAGILKGDTLTSAEQAQQSKQQAIAATKQAKRVKELEKQLEAERRKFEQSRKSSKNADVELVSAKSEIAAMKKSLAEYKAEMEQLQKAAGEGTIALQQLPELKTEIKSLSAENQTLVANYNSERVLRKKYYNMVEDMKGKIRVYCRVRPLSRTEKGNKNKFAVLVPDEYTVKIEMTRGGVKEFQFDQIFAETSSQENIFEDTHSLIQSAIDGYNVCIFAYGQTGSGKTYTMIGDNDQKMPGIAPRAFNRIFDIVQKNKGKFTFKFGDDLVVSRT